VNFASAIVRLVRQHSLLANMKKKKAHICLGCGYQYDEKKYGKFEDLDEDFLCPECKCEKDMFEEREVEQ